MTVLALVVEFLGTFVFLAANLMTGGNPWVIGGTLALLIYFVGVDTQCGYFNPAVTVATLMNRGITASTAAKFIAAQISGALFAVFIYSKLKTHKYL
jgi:glycerol uptake facilitator-like aquaporin